MKRLRLEFCLIAAVAAGCSSHPPQDLPPQGQTVAAEPSPGQQGESLVSLPPTQSADAEQAPEQQEEGLAAEPKTPPPTTEKLTKQEYEALASLPEAGSRGLQFYLGTQTFDYLENGEVLVSGPIASGKASSPTPTGKFRVLSKHKDKESSRYDNEIGTPAWMPYSMQFFGNYFLHEGYLPGQPASHGCIRLGHDHARLLFERMRIGDPITVTN
jgi:lipoprotein-anchoring transpeptidase ErfK/SrfK